MLLFILFKLTLRGVIADIPHDAGAIVIYLLLALFIGFIWAGSRGRPDTATRSRPAGEDHVR
jgi:hypothetical protein